MSLKLTNMLVSFLVAVSLLVAVAPQAAVWAEPPNFSDRVEKTLIDKIKANPTARHNVIISMQPGKWRDTKGLVEKAGGKFGRPLPIVDGGSALLPGSAILGMARNPHVLKIFEDSPVTVLGAPVSTVSTLAVKAPDVWSLGYTGKGIGVAVLDSGVAPHADLVGPTNRIIASVNLVGGTEGPGDLGGHGTHVAGIIAGNGYSSDGARTGIAPDANIVSVKVSDDTGSASYSSVIQGIQWVVRNKNAYNIRVMNISLGSTVTRSYADDPLIAAMEVAWFSGIVVVVAAGNEGPGAGTITSPGNDPYAITVGALDDMGTGDRSDDMIADFSSRGPTAIDNLAKPDLAAPGRRVVSLRAIDSYLDRLLPDRVVDNTYFRLSGTSMAAPVVAGVAALLLEKDPTLSPNQIKYLLTRTATPLNFDVNAMGAGSVDALAAIAYSGKDIANRKLRPNSNFARTIYPLAKGAPLVWRDPNYKGRDWNNYTWETLPWDNYTWENFSWESVDWGAASWSNYTWENFTWENFTWESVSWDNYTWDSSSVD